ncbi:MAG: hypothetical protein Q7U30_18955 [Methylicorpusculum sp.]|nr:hypothetical protein [Methylicorpusculum sp.]
MAESRVYTKKAVVPAIPTGMTATNNANIVVGRIRRLPHPPMLLKVDALSLIHIWTPPQLQAKFA